MPATVIAAIASLCTVMQVVCMNTAIQALVPDHFRGRVLALYSLAFFGLAPFGALALGIVSERTGTADGILLCAIIGLVASILVLIRWPNVINIEAFSDSKKSPQVAPILDTEKIAAD
jgi:MFS family permease